MTFEELATAFFMSYIIFPFTGYVPFHTDATERDRDTFLGWMRTVARLLLEEGVFDSPEDMRDEALMEYGIILPETIFEKKADD